MFRFIQGILDLFSRLFRAQPSNDALNIEPVQEAAVEAELNRSVILHNFVLPPEQFLNFQIPVINIHALLNDDAALGDDAIELPGRVGPYIGVQPLVRAGANEMDEVMEDVPPRVPVVERFNQFFAEQERRRQLFDNPFVERVLLNLVEWPNLDPRRFINVEIDNRRDRPPYHPGR